MEITRDKLVVWFCKTYPAVVKRLKEVSHFPEDRVNHPFHGEGPIWTHIMMVMTHIMCDEYLTKDDKNILLVVALFHDVGKPAALEVKHDDKNDMTKHSFNGHEGISVFKALDYYNTMEKEFDFYANSDVKLKIFELIGRHGTSIIQENYEMKFLQKRFRIADKEGAIRNVDEDMFAQYPKLKLAKKGTDVDGKELIILCGPQGSGKSTYARSIENKFDWYILSRDDEIMKFCEAYEDVNNYNDAWKFLYADEDRLQNFNEYFDRLIIDVSKCQQKVIIDMMMLTVGGRRKMLNVFSKFNKKCIVFLSPISELIVRNEEREKELSNDKLYGSIRKFTWPLKEEGFSSVEYKI